MWLLKLKKEGTPTYFVSRNSNEDDEVIIAKNPSKRILQEVCKNLNNSRPCVDLGITKNSSNIEKPIQKPIKLSKRITKELNVPNSTTRGKQTFCYFCKKLIHRLPRHLESIHHNEPEVMKFSGLPKGSQERRDIIGAIRKKGNFLYNTNKNYNKGFLIVVRRPQSSKQRDSNHYVFCPNCKGYFSKVTISRHRTKCEPNIKKGDRTIRIFNRKVCGGAHEKASNILRLGIFPIMRDDEITRLIRYDELAVIFGNKQCQKYTSSHHYPMIRSRLRLIGRLIIETRKLDSSVNEFADIFSPKFYDAVIKAVQIVAKLNQENRIFGAPATAFSCGTLLKKCGCILISECIKNEDKEKKKKVSDFLKLLTEDFGQSINKTVAENQAEHKRKKKNLIPSLEDIKTLHKYLLKHRREYYHRLNDKFSQTTWHRLASYTLISIQLFNRRRAGEIERIKIDDFKSYEGIEENSDAFKFLSKAAVQAARSYVRFMVRGKLNRTVPVLLDKEMFDCINLILKYRERVGVPQNNPYVFGIPWTTDGSPKYLRACTLLREYSEACGAKNPASLRGTQLRKHIATHSVLLNLKENEVSDLANFMGHHEKIHHEHYRIPIATRDITLMSNLLRKAQGNSSDEEEVEQEDRCTNLNVKVNSSNGDNTTAENTLPVGMPGTNNIEISSDVDNFLREAQTNLPDEEQVAQGNNWTVDEDTFREDTLPFEMPHENDKDIFDDTRVDNFLRETQTNLPEEEQVEQGNKSAVDEGAIRTDTLFIGMPNENDRDVSDDTRVDNFLRETLTNLPEEEQVEQGNKSAVDEGTIRIDTLFIGMPNENDRNISDDTRVDHFLRETQTNLPEEKQLEQGNKCAVDEDTIRTYTLPIGMPNESDRDISDEITGELKSNQEINERERKEYELEKYYYRSRKPKVTQKRENGVEGYSTPVDPYFTDGDSDLEYVPKTKVSKRKFKKYCTEQNDHDSDSSKGSINWGRRKKIKRVTWTTPEKNIVKTVFQNNLATGKLPSLSECQKVLVEHSSTIKQHRTPAQLKTWISNQIKKKKLSTRGATSRSWTTPEKHAARYFFRENIQKETLPSLRSCAEAQQRYPFLCSRSASTIKAWVNEEIKRQKRGAK